MSAMAHAARRAVVQNDAWWPANVRSTPARSEAAPDTVAETDTSRAVPKEAATWLIVLEVDWAC